MAGRIWITMGKRGVPVEYKKFKQCMLKYSNRDNQIPMHTAKMVLAWYGVCSDKRTTIVKDMIECGIFRWDNKRCLTIMNVRKK